MKTFPGSREHFVNNLAMHVGQTEVSSGVAIRETFVVKAQQMQDRCVQVVNVHSVLNGLETEFVRGAVHHSAADAAARHP